MYVIGEVESNWNWTAVNYNDPITIGMMQWYGTRAAALLNRIKDEQPSAYSQLSGTLQNDIETYDSSDGFWNYRYLNQDEGNSIVEVFQDKENHAIQENQAISDFEGYISTLENWGMSQDDPKPLVFAMSMYHQSPASCGQVVASAGGTADLDRIYSICMNHGVLGNYSNRYTTVYNRLNEWDGESMPPDFGQSGDTSSGGNNDGISKLSSNLNYIMQKGDYLYLFGKGEYAKGIPFYPSGNQLWKCGRNADGTTISGGNSGGGSETGSQAQKDVVALYESWIGQFDYSMAPGRLTPTESGYGDCSSTIWYAYQQVTGLDIGTWTGAMAGNGTEIATGSGDLPLDQMQLADIVLINWSWDNPSFDHVEMYVGEGQLCGHGGPNAGPTIKQDAQAYISSAYNWQVRRFL